MTLKKWNADYVINLKMVIHSCAANLFMYYWSREKKSFNNPHKKGLSMPIMPQALKCVHTKAHVSGPSKNIAVISISRHPGRADEEPSSASICSASIFRYRTVKISLSLQKWATSVFFNVFECTMQWATSAHIKNRVTFNCPNTFLLSKHHALNKRHTHETL